MVRHKEEDLWSDVKLPLCHYRTVRIDLSPRESVRYNQLVAMIKTNLITSRYEGDAL